MWNARNTGAMDQMIALADQCLSEYDENGWIGDACETFPVGEVDARLETVGGTVCRSGAAAAAHAEPAAGHRW